MTRADSPPPPVGVLYLELIGHITGGGQRSLLDMVTALDRTRFRPVVVCGASGTLVDRLRELGVSTAVVPMPTRRHPWDRAARAAVAQLTAIIRRERIALLHANQLRVALYALQASRHTRVPVVFHARITAADVNGVQGWWLDRYLAWRCRTIVAISEAVAARFSWLRGTDRLQVLWNGIDLEAFADHVDRSAFRRQLHIAPDVPLLGVIGMLEPRKGHDVLLEALPLILTRYPRAQVVMAGMEAPGHASYGERLRQLAARAGVSSHVHVTGFLEHIQQVLGSLHVCVMPVVQPEGLGRVAIEAGAMRCPVVATPLGGLREIIEDGVTGLLVPPGDPKALAAAILRLLDDPAFAQQLGAAARRRVEEQFSLSGMMARLQHIYDTVLTQ